MNEIWKTVVYQQKEFPDFEISNQGNLRNVNTNKIYKQWINKKGYCQVCVSIGGRNKKKVFKIHKAVAETFIPNLENKPQVNHIDGNKTNNNVKNLEWVTSQENICHAYDLGLEVPLRGVKNPYAKFTKDQVNYIRDNYIPKDKAFGCRALAKKFNTNHHRISDIVNYKTYVND